MRAAERRRAESARRVEQQAAAEAAARAHVEQSTAALLEKQRVIASDRAQRKERVQAMLSKKSSRIKPI